MTKAKVSFIGPKKKETLRLKLNGFIWIYS
jgi:hypothetical protein